MVRPSAEGDPLGYYPTYTLVSAELATVWEPRFEQASLFGYIARRAPAIPIPASDRQTLPYAMRRRRLAVRDQARRLSGAGYSRWRSDASPHPQRLRHQSAARAYNRPSERAGSRA